MALFAGTRLGAFQVIGTLGAGGMGEVYRARDTRLKRDVAVKIVPESFASDPERLARFQREAEVLASLNHTNIAHIYGIEEFNGTRGLVMELVEGPTLADRIAQGPIPVDEALSIAKQIAEALEAAHEQGIIHRDLKPANIKVRPDGTVKVLDFGLAKALEPASSANVNATASPTITSPAMMTGVGMLLGTAAYMSPEQARGKAVDKRSDVWAFGCVLYEMLAGRRAFEGEDINDTLANVLRVDPDWNALPPRVPPSVHLLLRDCLAKGSRERLADMSAALFVIRHPMLGANSAVSSVVAELKPRRSLWRRAAIATTLVASAGIVATVAIVRPEGVPAVMARFSIVLPEGQVLTNTGRHVVAVSPDGQNLVYVANQQLYLRRMDELTARPIGGTNLAASSPFFSPDGQWIGFRAGSDDTLKKIAVTGGAPVTLCPVTNTFGVSWEGDTIVFGQGGLVGDPRDNGIFAVPASGGTPELIVKADVSEQVSGPQLLPGTNSVVFASTKGTSGLRWDQADIVVFSRDTGERKVIIRGGSAPRYVSGHLVYALGGNLLAVPLDVERLEAAGRPVPVVEGVMRATGQIANTDAANFAIAGNGTLVYVPSTTGTGLIERTLVWVDRAQQEQPIGAPPRAYAHVRLSPDGSRLLLDVRDQESDMWSWDLSRQTLTRLTFGSDVERNPAWTPDGRRIVFSSNRTSLQSLFWQPADGTGSAERLMENQLVQDAMSVTPDGSRLLVRQQGGPTGADIYTLSLQGERRLTALVQTRFSEENAVVSPDGRWMAYQSSESGQNEIYVRPFPDVDGGRWQLSSGGGTRPLWARSGRELLYYVEPGTVMSVPIAGTAPFSAGTPTSVVDGPYGYRNMSPQWVYDVAPDGQRFVMIKEARQGPLDQQIVVVQNWFEELKRLVPVP